MLNFIAPKGVSKIDEQPSNLFTEANNGFFIHKGQ